MYFRKWWLLAAGALAVATMLHLGPPARAGFKIIVSDGTLTQTFTGVGGIATVKYFDSKTGVTVNGSAEAPPAPGTKTPNEADIFQQTLSVDAKKAATVTISEVANNIALPPGPGLFTSEIASSKDAKGKYTFQSWIDAGNSLTVGAGVSPTGLQGPNSTTGDYLASGTSPGGIGGNPFAMSNKLTITFSGKGSLNSDGTTTAFAAPEPASMALWLTGLPVLGLSRFWRRRQRGSSAIA